MAKVSVFQSTPPGWEATSNSIKGRRNLLNFNPRLPGGRRLLYLLSSTSKILNFNPRLPGGRRPRCGQIKHCNNVFQSTPPGWEATPWFPQTAPHSRNFNPRLSGGRRLGHRPLAGVLRGISIHASRVGGDLNVSNPIFSENRFQSTPPGWEATAEMVKLFDHFCVKVDNSYKYAHVSSSVWKCPVPVYINILNFFGAKLPCFSVHFRFAPKGSGRLPGNRIAWPQNVRFYFCSCFQDSKNAGCLFQGP